MKIHFYFGKVMKNNPNLVLSFRGSTTWQYNSMKFYGVAWARNGKYYSIGFISYGKREYK